MLDEKTVCPPLKYNLVETKEFFHIGASTKSKDLSSSIGENAHEGSPNSDLQYDYKAEFDIPQLDNEYHNLNHPTASSDVNPSC